MSKHKHKNFNHFAEQNQPNTDEKNNEQFEKEEELVDPYAKSEDDLVPPQDLNLKLQIEKENSIALTKILKQLQADFDNFRKRNANTKKEAYDDGVFDCAKRMMKCYDAVEGALKTIEDEKVKQGLQILEREFLNAFEEFGIKPIEALGKPFDANLHNAISSEENSEVESGTVVQEIQKGFQTSEKVIRYSLVVIAK